MNPEKIDYERLGDDYIADNGGIEDAFRKIDMPVYVIFRHGVYKRYLSRSAAIERLARVMTSRVFRVLDLPVRYDSIFDPQKNSWVLGGRTENYFNCKDRAKRRILQLLAKKRENEKWENDYRKWVDKREKLREELYKRKPF